MTRKLRLLSMGILCLALVANVVFAEEAAPVLQGIDSLFTPQYIKLIKNKKIAIVANQASVNRDENSIVDLLLHYPQAQVVALFTPEHGFSVKEDDKVTDNDHAKLPIYSLYGPRKSPTADQLSDVDVIVFDLETVGLRYYTYITTLAMVMKSAKENQIPIVVLDRVNPLGGSLVTGAMLDEKYVGNFAGYYSIPTRYGLTMGELARFYNRYFKIEADLSVVPLRNWRRDMLFSDTNLTWHAPSPALPTFEQAFLYSIFGLFESLQLAVGRSQTNKEAFKRYGAPWISAEEARRLVAQLNNLKLSGLKFDVAHWTPDRAQYQGKPCNGFSVKITDLKDINTLRTFIQVSEVLSRQFKSKIRLASMDGMIGSSSVRKAIEQDESTDTIIDNLKENNRQFIQQREKVLLY